MSSPCSSRVSRSGRSAGKPVQIDERQRALAVRAAQVHDGVERGERDAHVRRMRRDTARGPAENRVVAVEAVDRIAAGAGRALVAARGVVVEIDAARALQDVAADGGHVADLAGRARENRARQHREARAHGAVLGDRRIACRRADHEPAVLALLDRRVQVRDVDERGRPLDRFAHQVDEIRAAAQVFAAGAADEMDRVGPVGRADIVERVHRAASGRVELADRGDDAVIRAAAAQVAAHALA